MRRHRVSGGEWAGLIAALALVALVLLLAIPLLKLGRTLDETTLTIRQAREQATPILSQASTTVAHVNSNLERVDDITGNAANVSSKDRKSTRLNSSHANISYAVFCL